MIWIHDEYAIGLNDGLLAALKQIQLLKEKVKFSRATYMWKQ